MLTADRLREVLAYEDGVFRWVRPRGKRAAGAVAGTINVLGYVVICIDSRQYYAHRLAWLYVHGEWPKGEIDHRDMCKSNNKIENLRDATRSENNANRGTQRPGRLKGTTWHKRAGRWMASIQVKGRNVYLGLHDTEEAAHAAYLAAAKEHYGDFARAA